MKRPCLLVELSEVPGDNVFISTSHEDEFNELRMVIEQAVRSVGHTPIDIGKPPQFEGDSTRSNSFIVDCKRGIQSSKVVIAVCSPDPRYNTTNPNVTHELGLAESLGKATILVTNNQQPIPSNLVDMRRIDYIDSDVSRGEFQEKLVENLQEVLRRIDQYGIIDQSNKSVKVAMPQHWIHLEPELWNAFAQIIDRGKKVHHAVQPLESLHLAALQGLVLDILYDSQGSPMVDIKKSGLLIAWGKYRDAYHKELKKLKNAHDSILSFYDILINHVNNLEDLPNEKIKENLEKSRDFYNQKNDAMDKYDQEHSDAQSFLSILEKNFEWGSSNAPAQLFHKLNSLILHSRLISTHADSMILNLVNLFT